MVGDIRQTRLASQIRECVRYRNLIRSLVVRDLKARYRNSLLGFLWSLLNPLLMMVVFTFVFTVLFPSSMGKSYPVFFLSGLLPWQFFTNCMTSSTRSIVDNAHLIKKVYFPKEVLPIAGILSNLVNFLLALAVLFALLPLFQVRVTPWVVLLPLIILIQLLFTIGLSFILSTLNVFFRDIQHIMETLMLIWFFLTPVFYSLEDMPTRLIWRTDLHSLIYAVNPMASLIAAHRAVLFQGGAPSFLHLAVTSAVALSVFVVGSLTVNHYSSTFAEEL